MAKKKALKKIRVGVIGVGRGQTFMAGAERAGMELVAICDTWKERLKSVGKKFGIATYTDYDKFLEHDLDAVVLANYFHQHAPFAIKALEAGRHVMSECAACSTLAEGVALCRAVERSKRIYMFAENYPFTAFNLELARLYKQGEIGRVLYAEGEYNHPGSYEWHASISPGLKHWRNNLPVTYYCTHAMAPLMSITKHDALARERLRGPAARGLEQAPAVEAHGRRRDHHGHHGQRRGVQARPGRPAGPQHLLQAARRARPDGDRPRARVLGPRQRESRPRRVGPQEGPGAESSYFPQFRNGPGTR